MAVCGNKCDLAREVDQKALTSLLEKHKMKYFETSARSGNNVENMFLGLIDEINALQAARRKKQPEDDLDLNPPLTTDNLKSDRLTTRANDTQSEREEERGQKLKEAGQGRRFCCFG
jgi:GTPase SAR1 family protein